MADGDSLVAELAASKNKIDKNTDRSATVETSFVQQKSRRSEGRHKSLKKAACSVKKARQQGRKRAVAGEEGSGSNTNDESEHSNKFSNIFKWNKIGTSVDEEWSSGADKKTGTPESVAGPRIEITQDGIEEIGLKIFPRDLDTVTIALSKSSNSFDQNTASVHFNNNIARPESLSSSNSSLGNLPVSIDRKRNPKLRDTLSSGNDGSQPQIFISGDVTPPGKQAMPIFSWKILLDGLFLFFCIFH